MQEALSQAVHKVHRLERNELELSARAFERMALAHLEMTR
jgi:hypothetical protein